jgi:ABC-2 type transport system ATP-binding protein
MAIRPASASTFLPRASTVVEARGVSRRFGDTVALAEVALELAGGEIHALLGPNGAGKTTLLRILSGLLIPDTGDVHVLGVEVSRTPRALRQLIGLIPSGDRTFYLRLSGLENLTFFGRLHGLRRRDAVAQARRALAEVGLENAADSAVGVYSHGMQKRLSVARALLVEPAVFLVDEATHDLDPDGARRVRELIQHAAAARGSAVVWATQRLDEIRGFADQVTLLGGGRVRFSGTVPELMALATPRRYLVRLRNGTGDARSLRETFERALAGKGDIVGTGEGVSEHYVLTLDEGVILGDAIASLVEADVQVLACREERSQLEEAFLAVTGEER